MRGYLSVRGGDERIPLEQRTEIYRDPDDGEQILVETETSSVSLGLADVTVSRKRDGKAPIVIEPRADCIEVRNEGNTNGLTIVASEKNVDVGTGYLKRIRRDARLEIGYHTVLTLEVEREAREEYVIEGDVAASGDVVMGDATEIDRSTTVEDSVVNRSDIGGEGGAEVTDSVVNRSNVGGEGDAEGKDNRRARAEDQPKKSNPTSATTDEEEEDTQSFCETHQLAYSSNVCPKCNASFSDDDSTETKFCMHCGNSISMDASVCPACGNEQETA